MSDDRPPGSVDLRLEALARYGRLADVSRERLDELAALAALACETPIALITFLEISSIWLVERPKINEAGQAPRCRRQRLAIGRECRYTVTVWHKTPQGVVGGQPCASRGQECHCGTPDRRLG